MLQSESRCWEEGKSCNALGSCCRKLTGIQFSQPFRFTSPHAHFHKAQRVACSTNHTRHDLNASLRAALLKGPTNVLF